jgi:hypothetical protein
MTCESRKFGFMRMLIMSSLVVALMACTAMAQQDQINTVIGGGPNNIPAVDADVVGPNQVSFDNSGNYYVAASTQNQVFKVNGSTGTLTVLAGNGTPGYSGDGVTGEAANAELNGPTGVTVDAAGNVYIADEFNCVVRKVDTTNTITTVVGVAGSCGYNQDGSPATAHEINLPQQLAVDNSANIYIADFGNARIRKFDPSTNTISTVAGSTGTAEYCVNGTAATRCHFTNTPAVAVDTSTTTGPDIFLTDFSECVIYKISHANGDITTVAGTPGVCGSGGDGGAATSAQINPNYGQLAANGSGTWVLLADRENSVIRKATVGGNIKTVAGDHSSSYSGDGGPATSAALNSPIGVTEDAAGDLFIGDFGNNRVREVPCFQGGTCTPPSGDIAGDIYTVAGNGSTNGATSTNGLPAPGIALSNPEGVVADPSDNIFVSDTENSYLRELLNSTGDVNLFAGDGTVGYGGDKGPATSAEITYPQGISRDAAGDIFFADVDNDIVREVVPSGEIFTVAGTPGEIGYSGDGASAAEGSQLGFPHDVFVDDHGNLFIADTYNNVIREVVCLAAGTLPCTPPAGKTAGYIYTVAGNFNKGSTYSGDGGPATSAGLDYPGSVAADGVGNLYISDSSNCRIREVTAATGIINTIAGNGDCAFTGDGIAMANSVSFPWGIRVDLNGNVFFADTDNNLIRWVDGGGTLTTFAGNTNYGFSGDGGPATSAELSNPLALSEDAEGNFFIADTYNNRIREINAFAAVGRSTGSLNFPGTQAVGTTSAPLKVTLSGIGPASIESISASAGFKVANQCVGSLPNGTTCTVSVSFAPTTTGTQTGTLTVNTNGYLSTATTVALKGVAGGPAITGSLAFGNDVINTAVTKSITVTGATTFSSVALTGDSTDFTIVGNTCTGAVTTSCVIQVKFDPQSTGAKNATLVIKDSDPSSPQSVAATGTGTTSNESFNPASVTYATHLVNTESSNKTITFTYTGTGTLTLTGLTASNANFSVNETGIASGACVPGTTTLTENESCTFNVVFCPGTTPLGTITGAVTASFTGDPANTSIQLPLTGTATEVSLSPATLAFGTVTSGTENLAVTVKNAGTTPLTFSGTPTVTGTGSAQFTVLPYASPSTSTCLNGSVTLTQNQTCTFTVEFTSTGKGLSYTNDLNIPDNGGASPQQEPMTATD